MARGAGRAARARASTSTRCACAPFRSRTSVADFVAAHDEVFVVEQNRDAQMRTLLVNELADRPGAADRRCCTTTARRSPRASSPRPSPSTCTPRAADARHDEGKPRMTYLAKPKLHHPTLAKQQGRLHAARLRRQDLHAVRRLRPRLDLGGHHPGLLGARHRAAPRRQALGHRLQLEDARLFPRRLARLQHRARPHALGADRRQPRQPRAALPRRLRRRRLGLDRPRPVRARHAPRRATWSTSSRTTASTA